MLLYSKFQVELLVCAGTDQYSRPSAYVRGALRRSHTMDTSALLPGPAADIKVTTSDLRGQVGRIQNQVKEIQEVVRMYSSTTGPRRVRRQKMDIMSPEPTDTNVRLLLHTAAVLSCPVAAPSQGSRVLKGVYLCA